MKQFNARKVLFTVLILTTGLAACKKDDDINGGSESRKYNNGFFLLAEGSFGRNAGTLSYYSYGSDEVVPRVYEAENPGKILSNTAYSSTLQFATVINESIYLVSKYSGPIVKINKNTLKEEARFDQESSNWKDIIQVEGSRGLVSSNDGVYQIDLNTLSVQNKLTSVGALKTGDMWKNGNHVYLLQSNGTKIVSASNYSLVKTFSDVNRGFVQTPNGKVWGSTGSRLIAFDSKLDTAGVALSVPVPSTGNEAPTRLTASTKENAVFYHNGKSIYKYIDGNEKSLDQPFITISENPFILYGSIRYDKNKDYIVVNGIPGYGAASTINYLLIYNASTGALVKKVQYGGDGVNVDFSKIFFNALTIFK